MVRRYAEPVRVGTASRLTPDSLADLEQVPPGPGGYAASSPTWFEWAGRRYHVRAILAHWRERRAWWREVLDADPTPEGHLHRARGIVEDGIGPCLKHWLEHRLPVGHRRRCSRASRLAGRGRPGVAHPHRRLRPGL
ncbi:MAG: hypothetical protein IPI13_16190 [Actinomycetales bacterium]|uniref:DUF6504 domain-containing protein n=1 Tax=Candidatus Phosphoribacter hodrii TaxID=2953743 RepID=A0A935IM11_9MICO|nr:hypothetical protein [Candidatus Phosphoribacter hodrii]